MATSNVISRALEACSDIGGILAFIGLISPRVASIFTTRLAERHKATLAQETETLKAALSSKAEQLAIEWRDCYSREFELFKQSVTEFSQEKTRLRKRMKKVCEKIIRCKQELGEIAICHSTCLSVTRKFLREMDEHEHELKRFKLYSHIEKIDYIIDEDPGFYENMSIVLDLQCYLQSFFLAAQPYVNPLISE